VAVRSRRAIPGRPGASGFESIFTTGKADTFSRDAGGLILFPVPLILRPVATADDDLKQQTRRRGGLTLRVLSRAAIAYLVSQYPTITHTYLLREIQHLRATGWDVVVISIAPPDRPPDRLTPEEHAEWSRTFYVKTAGVTAVAAANLRTFFKRPLRYLHTLASALFLGHGRVLANCFYFLEAVVAGDLMQRCNVSHVHAHFSSTVALLLGRLFPITWSATIHGSAEFYDPVGFSLREKIREASFIVGISHFGRAQMMRLVSFQLWHKLIQNKLGIDIERYRHSELREDAPIRLIAVGRLEPQKGQHLILSAMSLLRKAGYDLRLSLVGRGPDEESLRHRVQELGLEDVVIFHGWRNQDEVCELNKQSHIHLLPSFAEGVPLVLMEAMAVGTPCIASRITGNPELIEHGAEGLLITPGSEDSLVQAIRILADSPELRRQFSILGRHKIENEFNLAVNTARLATIFEAHLGRK
jgi:glycosyltransferase involved in cell wall biosynthesis